jgi:hypothetical protein
MRTHAAVFRATRASQSKRFNWQFVVFWVTYCRVMLALAYYLIRYALS